jgi:plastocyanin
MRAMTIPLLLLVPILSGCVSETKTLPQDVLTPPLPSVTLSLINHTSELNTSRDGYIFSVLYDLGLNTTDPNATRVLDEVGFVWGNRSVPEVNATQYYENNETEEENVTVPSLNRTSDAYLGGHPDGTYYGRVFYRINNTTTYGPEVSVIMTTPAPPPPPPPVIKTITIGATTPSSVADYSPLRLTMTVGEAVVFDNKDSIGHTGTDRNGGWDTGTIAGGAKSTPIVMSTAGTYTYKCNIHATMIGGIIEVAAR